jgi:predicted Rossmann fold nucleotide-binding protein DprA/Smf involved in DNA uptake
MAQMDIRRLGQGDPSYPSALQLFLSDRAPTTLTALGNLDLLQRKKLALFCSVKCPGNLILQTYDLTRALRDAGVTVIGGFHSPMEKECLALLLRGTQPVIVCPARSIDRMRLPTAWKAPLAEGRLLLLSPFAEKLRRVTTDLAQRRNEFVAALADEVFVAHAAPGSKTERFCRDVLAWGKSLLTLESDENAPLLALGAKPLRPESVSGQWATATSEAPTESVGLRYCRTS